MEMFGPYRLEGRLGEGGMGEVFRAYDTRRQRSVALKRLRPGLAADVDYQERFRRESLIAAKISSPHVVPIHDFGEIDGRLFIDMRLVEGPDLGQLIERFGPLPPQRAVQIVRQVADALDAAHAGGLVHRDVKPSNVLVSSVRDRDFAYLVDFGIVRTVTGDGSSSLTAVGSAVGTLAYMAPEVLGGGQVDHRADVYALGCLLHEALTGRAPFAPADGPALMYHHVNSEPPRPSTMRPGISPGLDAVVAYAMAKDPGWRYQTAGQLADAAQLAVSAPPPPPQAPPPLPPPPPRRTGLIVALVAVSSVLLLLVGLIVLGLVVGDDEESAGTASPTTAPRPTTTTSAAPVPVGPVEQATDGTFEVAVPAGWVAESSSDLLFLRTDDQFSNMSVIEETNAGPGTDLGRLAQIYAEGLVSGLDATIDAAGIESTTVAGAPARAYTYDLPADEMTGSPTARGRQIVLEQGGRFLLITFSSTPETYVEDLPDLEVITSSWRFLQ